MMNVQDALLKAMARNITRRAAAEILGVTDLTTGHWREQLAEGQVRNYSGSNYSLALPAWGGGTIVPYLQ
jgi:hypothetical protein